MQDWQAFGNDFGMLLGQGLPGLAVLPVNFVPYRLFPGLENKKTF